jgi:hypothetical protein
MLTSACEHFEIHSKTQNGRHPRSGKQALFATSCKEQVNAKPERNSHCNQNTDINFGNHNFSPLDRISPVFSMTGIKSRYAIDSASPVIGVWPPVYRQPQAVFHDDWDAPVWHNFKPGTQRPLTET